MGFIVVMKIRDIKVKKVISTLVPTKNKTQNKRFKNFYCTY